MLIKDCDNLCARARAYLQRKEGTRNKKERYKL